MVALQDTISNFKKVYKRNWQGCNRTESRFLKKHGEWLKGEVSLPTAPVAGTSQGRPCKDFGELSDRSMRRNTADLRKNVCLDELAYATQMSHRAAGNVDASKVMKDIAISPTRAAKFRKAVAIGTENTTTKKHSPEEALAIFVEANLTKSQYEVIHQANRNIHPCYRYLQNGKQDYYPPKSVCETFGEVKLQDLVNHTTFRLCKYLEPVIETIRSERSCACI